MWSNYALALYRTLARHRLYAALNVLGLSLGIAVFIVLMLVVRFETSFDRWMPDGANIYRINQQRHDPGRPSVDSPSTQPVLLPSLMAAFPQIRTAARLMERDVIVRSGPQQAYEEVVFADPGIFDVFRLPFAAGDPKAALGDTSGLVVSPEAARKYFGTEKALGRTITLVVDGQPRDYRVTGVLKDLPPNTHLKLDFVARFSPEIFPSLKPYLSDWGSSMLFTYVVLRSPAEAAAVQAALPAFIDRSISGFRKPVSAHLVYELVAVPAIHFRDARTSHGFKPGTDPLFVAALGIMGVVTLLIAIVNYVSLATARAGMRAREVAVRKAMGATRWTLIVQFVAESIAVALGAGLVGAAMAELAARGASVALGEPIRISYFGAGGIAPYLLALAVLVGLASGVYPALVLSSFRPASVLASARTPGGGRAGARVREALAIFQFAVAITLMVCTAVVFAQIQHMRNADVGFRREGLIIVHRLGQDEVKSHSEATVETFRHLPGVVSATASNLYPASGSISVTNVKLLSNPAVEPDIDVVTVGPDYAKTYGLQLAAGRVLGRQLRLDDAAVLNSTAPADRQLNLMINESAARSLGFPDLAKAVGQKVSFGQDDSGKPVLAEVVGVVKDVRFLNPHRRIDPTLYVQDSRLAASGQGGDWSATVRVRETDAEQVTAELGRAWRAMVPGVPFEAETVQAALKPYYDPDARRGQLFAAGAVLSGLIACLGLYGLAAFNTGRRFKEIGIRKTLGASTRDVLRLLIGEFLRPVLIANLIAWPLAWFAMRSWLEGFDQRIALNPIYLVGPTIAAVVVAVLTVADQTFRVAKAEPAIALRYE